jgi:sugar lactone lactonase YvrE
MNIRKRVSLLGVLAVCLLSACSVPEKPAERAPDAAKETPATEAAPVALWTVTESVDAPASVYMDPEPSGYLFASLIVSQPYRKDGNGRIMRMDWKGGSVESSWVTGLDAPKGLRKCAGTLWVADIDELVGIDRSGKITSRVPIKDAKSLNDVACADDGTVYVSDTIASRIYAVKKGNVSVFAEGDDIEYPNGLLVERHRLVVGGWGKPDADFSTKVPGRLFALDYKTKQKTVITPAPFANMGGLESDGMGGYIISDPTTGKLLQVSAKGEVHLVRQFKPGTGYFAYIVGDKTAIIPHMTENTIAAYDVSDAVK